MYNDWMCGDYWWCRLNSMLNGMLWLICLLCLFISVKGRTIEVKYLNIFSPVSVVSWQDIAMQFVRRYRHSPNSSKVLVNVGKFLLFLCFLNIIFNFYFFLPHWNSMKFIFLWKNNKNNKTHWIIVCSKRPKLICSRIVWT